MPTAKLSSLAADADRCVTCGLCVPLCPTWKITHNEANSPRGRIMLMATLAQSGQVPAGSEHFLDACLGCGVCEQVCPNDVPYMRMLPQAKAHMKIRTPLLARFLASLATKPGRLMVLQLAGALAKAAHFLRLDRILPKSLAALVTMGTAISPPVPTPPMRRRSITNETNEQLQLFQGCFGPVVDGVALAASTSLLEKCGYAIRMPLTQGCCGAIAQHAGDLVKAQLCTARNNKAFISGLPVTTTASGCAAHIEHDANFTHNHIEAGKLVAERAQRLLFKDAHGLQVLVHQPCTQRMLPDSGSWVTKLLGQIPGLKVKMAPDNETCCGAGGLTYLSHPVTGMKLADRKVSALQTALQPPTVIVTTNHGCRMHLTNAWHRARVAARFTHPLTLAAEHVIDSSD